MKSSFVLLVFLLPALSMAEYKPYWPSLDSRPLPSWYDEAKVGIFMHFGPYAVPGVESEWFWMQSVRNESAGDQRCAKYLEDYFPPKFTYQDFGPMLIMDFFNSDAFADIVAESGAKYFVFTSKHHDGFCNWPSTYTYGWNSEAIGPQRNVIQELKDSFQSRHPDIHFGLYYSLFEWFNPIYLKDKANNMTTREYALNKMLPEMKELVENFHPHVLWVDGDWEAHPDYFGSKEFLAWLYNESPVKDQVVTNDRWGIGTSQKHGDFFSGPDRFNPGSLQAHKWENAMTVDVESWGIRRNINLDDVLSSQHLIKELASTVSCGGNILINGGPTKEGTIIPIFQERLRDVGNWLKVNGEAIYASKPWTSQNDSASNVPVWYTKKADVVYAIVLEWPDNDELHLADPKAIEQSTEVSMVGYKNETLPFKVEGGIMKISYPQMSKVMKESGKSCLLATVIKLEHLRVETEPQIDIVTSA